MPKLQHLEGNAFYSERDINCFPRFRTLLQARGRRGDDTRRLKIIWQAAREAAAIKSGVRALAERAGCRSLLGLALSCCVRWSLQSYFCRIGAARLAVSDVRGAERHLEEMELLAAGILTICSAGSHPPGAGAHAAPSADNWAEGCAGE